MRNDANPWLEAGLPSGPWSCRWNQESRTELEDLCLSFDKGSVRGTGMDADGIFEYRGWVYADGSLSLTKVYTLPYIPVPANLSYIGKWAGGCASGQWIDDAQPDNHGPFRMWPGTGPGPALERERSNTPTIEAGASGAERVPVLAPQPKRERKNHGG